MAIIFRNLQGNPHTPIDTETGDVLVREGAKIKTPEEEKFSQTVRTVENFEKNSGTIWDKKEDKPSPDPNSIVIKGKDLKIAETVLFAGIKVKTIEDHALVVPEWFAAKKFSEKGYNFYSPEILAILGETEKAYKVIIGDYFHRYLTTWCPKSIIDISDNSNEHDQTFVCDYDTFSRIAQETRRWWS